MNRPGNLFLCRCLECPLKLTNRLRTLWPTQSNPHYPAGLGSVTTGPTHHLISMSRLIAPNGQNPAHLNTPATFGPVASIIQRAQKLLECPAVFGKVRWVDTHFRIAHILLGKRYPKFISDMGQVFRVLEPLNGRLDNFIKPLIIGLVQKPHPVLKMLDLL